MSRKNKAFSIAEAMMTLVVISVVMAASAPLISKTIKNDTFADMQAKFLNQKIEEVDKKWTWTDNKTNITRTTGNVGIGVELPSAKFHIKNNIAAVDSIKVERTINGVNYIPFSVTDKGTSVRSVRGDINEPIFNITDNSKDANDHATNRFMVFNDGTVKIRPNNVFTAFQVQNVNDGYESTVLTKYSNDNSISSNSGFSVLGNGAIRMNYKEFQRDGVGDNTSVIGPVGIYVDGGQRFWIKESGQTVIHYATGYTGSEESVFLVQKCDNNCGPSATNTSLFSITPNGIVNVGVMGKEGQLQVGKAIYAGLNASNGYDVKIEDGDIKIKGVSVASSLNNMDEKYAKINNELNEYKALVAELKMQNDVLMERMAIMEATYNNKILNETYKIVKKDLKENNFTRLLGINK